MKFLFGILLLSLGIGLGPLMAQNQKASDKASETGMIIPSGTIMPYAGATAPAGWAFAAGQEYNTTGTYAKLFAAIGTAYCTNDHGAGGACTTGVFRLPDLRGRFIGGKDNMNGVAANRITSSKTLDATILGKAGGNQTYTPQGAIPGHYHGHSLATSIGVTGGIASLTGTTTFPSTSHAHVLNDFGYAQINVVEAGGNAIADFRRTTGPVTTYSSNIRMATTAGGGYTGHTNGIALSGRTDNLSTDTASIGISSTPASMTGSNTVTGTIGLASGSGGCDGNNNSTCLLIGNEGNNLSPTVILNYIIKL